MNELQAEDDRRRHGRVPVEDVEDVQGKNCNPEKEVSHAGPVLDEEGVEVAEEQANGKEDKEDHWKPTGKAAVGGEDGVLNRGGKS